MPEGLENLVEWDQQQGAFRLPQGMNRGMLGKASESRKLMTQVLEKRGIIGPKQRKNGKARGVDGTQLIRQELIEYVPTNKQRKDNQQRNAQTDNKYQQERLFSTSRSDYYERTFDKGTFLRTNIGEHLYADIEQMIGLQIVDQEIPDTAVEIKLIKTVSTKKGNDILIKHGAYFLGTFLLQKEKVCYLLKLICKALIWGMNVSQLEKEIYRGSNLCLNYAWGLCIHPECNCSHDRDYQGILFRYVQTRNRYSQRSHGGQFVKIEDQQTEIGQIVQIDKQRLNFALRKVNYFQANRSGRTMIYLGDYSRILHGLCISSGMNEQQGGMLPSEMREKKNCVRIIRQYLMGQAHMDDLAVRYAFIQIFHDKRVMTQTWYAPTSHQEKDAIMGLDDKMEDWTQKAREQYMIDNRSIANNIQAMTPTQFFQSNKWTVYKKAQFIYNPDLNERTHHLRLRGNSAPYSNQAYDSIYNKCENSMIEKSREMIFDDTEVMYYDLNQPIETMKQYVSNRRFWEEQQETAKPYGQFVRKQLGTYEKDSKRKYYDEYFPMLRSTQISSMDEASILVQALKRGLLSTKDADIANNYQGKYHFDMTSEIPAPGIQNISQGARSFDIERDVTIISKRDQTRKIILREMVRLAQQLENLPIQDKDLQRIIHREEGKYYLQRIDIFKSLLSLEDAGLQDSISTLMGRMNEENTPGLQEMRRKQGLSVQDIKKYLEDPNLLRAFCYVAEEQCTQENVADHGTNWVIGNIMIVRINKGGQYGVLYVAEIDFEEIIQDISGHFMSRFSEEEHKQYKDEKGKITEEERQQFVSKFRVTEKECEGYKDDLEKIYSTFYTKESLSSTTIKQMMTISKLEVQQNETNQMIKQKENEIIDAAILEQKILRIRKQRYIQEAENKKQLFRNIRVEVPERQSNKEAEDYKEERDREINAQDQEERPKYYNSGIKRQPTIIDNQFEQRKITNYIKVGRALIYEEEINKRNQATKPNVSPQQVVSQQIEAQDVQMSSNEIPLSQNKSLQDTSNALNQSFRSENERIRVNVIQIKKDKILAIAEAEQMQKDLKMINNGEEDKEPPDVGEKKKRGRQNSTMNPESGSRKPQIPRYAKKQTHKSPASQSKQKSSLSRSRERDQREGSIATRTRRSSTAADLQFRNERLSEQVNQDHSNTQVMERKGDVNNPTSKTRLRKDRRSQSSSQPKPVINYYNYEQINKDLYVKYYQSSQEDTQAREYAYMVFQSKVPTTNSALVAGTNLHQIQTPIHFNETRTFKEYVTTIWQLRACHSYYGYLIEGSDRIGKMEHHHDILHLMWKQGTSSLPKEQKVSTVSLSRHYKTIETSSQTISNKKTYHSYQQTGRKFAKSQK
ncbi:UNKNOWN [Stylonychia lemnae]|uniref:Uncharacterized protein n=1 Tax=Stylonychia lemnae TaxID=5949 RepID=A0A078A9E9_STYLE|nr:UNKNOWN [Stylonychia lemnae]|eukprot:CDW78844.1 UNKNOWN [Stylonychia lemnae]